VYFIYNHSFYFGFDISSKFLLRNSFGSLPPVVLGRSHYREKRYQEYHDSTAGCMGINRAGKLGNLLAQSGVGILILPRSLNGIIDYVLEQHPPYLSHNSQYHSILPKPRHRLAVSSFSVIETMSPFAQRWAMLTNDHLHFSSM
jgi:hypothetical protein